VFLIEVLVCPRCGGTRRLLAAIQDPESIRKVLGSLWLLADVPLLPASGGGGTHDIPIENAAYYEKIFGKIREAVFVREANKGKESPSAAKPSTP
jgi:hypothetical protein